MCKRRKVVVAGLAIVWMLTAPIGCGGPSVGSPVEAGAPRAPATEETPREALVAFWQAFLAGDEQQVDRRLTGTQETVRAVKAFCACVHALDRLEKKVQKAYGESILKKLGDGNVTDLDARLRITEEDAKRLPVIREDHDVAFVWDKHSSDWFRLVRRRGRWLLDAASVELRKDKRVPLKLQTAMFEAIAKAAREQLPLVGKEGVTPEGIKDALGTATLDGWLKGQREP